MEPKYKIDNETNLVEIFTENDEIPSVYQNAHPNGTPWEDFNDAEKWAKDFIDAMINPVVVQTEEI